VIAIFPSVRARLLALVLVASVPVAAIAGGNAVARYQQGLDPLLSLATSRREADSARYATALDDLQNLVTRLAADARLTPDACPGALSGIGPLFGERFSNLWLLDSQGRVVCDDKQTPSDTLLDGLAFRRSIAARAFALGDITAGRLSGRPVLPAAAPILSEGQVVGAVAGAIRMDWFRDVARRRTDEPAHLTWLLDAAGTLSSLREQPPGTEPAPALIEELRLSPVAQTRIGASAEGAEYAYSIGALDRGARVIVGLPAIEARREAQRMLLARFFNLAVFLSACAFIILYGAEVSCTRPVRRLAAQVRAWKPGTAFAAPRSQWDPDEVIALGQAVTNAADTISRREAELTQALHQRDLLLAEIHHRVKNNLQIVASLLNMQGERIQDARLRAEFETARERVQALSTLHRHLYMQGDIAAVALAPLLRELVAQFASASEVTISADPAILPAEQATSFALLVAEALANAAKHAFRDGRSGRIAVELRERDGMATLEISDDGVGLPPEMPQGSSMGITLIRGFAAHLGGQIEFSGEGGTRLRITFPTQAR
jgi:two-component sensor histidine kinase